MKFLIVALLALTSSLALAAPSEVRILKEKQIEGGLPDLSPAEQKAIHKHLGTYGMGRPDFYYLSKDHALLRAVSPAAVHLLYRPSERRSQANCYWYSLFATGVLSGGERGMGEEEYVETLAKHFIKLPLGAAWQPGDVMRFQRPRADIDMHSAYYLGVSGARHLFLTKNGSERGPYLLMSYSDLTRKAYYNARLEGVYRRR